MAAIAGLLSSACINPNTYEITPLDDASIVSRDLSTASTLRILVFGDSGTQNDNQFKTAEQMVRVCAIRGCDMAIGLGDNFYPDGVKDVADEQWQKGFEVPYAGVGGDLPIDFWMVLGNHDWAENAQAQIDYTLQSERWRMPYKYYTVPGLPSFLKLVAFDSQSLVEPPDKDAVRLAQDQRRFMEEQICEGEGWHIVFAHHPALSSGSLASPEVSSFLSSIDTTCNIHIFLSGHEHFQEHLRDERMDMIVQGAAGKVSDSDNESPASLYVKDALGFAILSIDAEFVQIEFFDDDGMVHYQTSIAFSDAL